MATPAATIAIHANQSWILEANHQEECQHGNCPREFDHCLGLPAARVGNFSTARRTRLAPESSSAEAFTRLPWLKASSLPEARPRPEDPLKHLCEYRQMTDDRYLHVEVRGGEIIVTLPSSNYKVVYYKSAEPGPRRHPIATRSIAAQAHHWCRSGAGCGASDGPYWTRQCKARNAAHSASTDGLLGGRTSTNCRGQGDDDREHKPFTHTHPHWRRSSGPGIERLRCRSRRESRQRPPVDPHPHRARLMIKFYAFLNEGVNATPRSGVYTGQPRCIRRGFFPADSTWRRGCGLCGKPQRRRNQCDRAALISPGGRR